MAGDDGLIEVVSIRAPVKERLALDCRDGDLPKFRSALP